MDAYSESRQRVFVAVKYILSATNKFVVVAAKIPLAASKTRCLDMLEHETLGYKKGCSSHFEEEKREMTIRTYF